MSLKVTEICTIWKLGYGFHSNYGCISYHFRDKPRYWPKIAAVPCPPVLDAPVRGSLSEYCHTVSYGKTRMVWPPHGETSLMIIQLLRQNTSVCDERTDILWQHSPHYAQHRKVIIMGKFCTQKADNLCTSIDDKCINENRNIWSYTCAMTKSKFTQWMMCKY